MRNIGDVNCELWRLGEVIETTFFDMLFRGSNKVLVVPIASTRGFVL
jgi:hypothetical protein